MITPNHIKEYMATNKISVAQLSKSTGMSATTLHAIFDRNDAKVSQINAMLEALGIEPVDLEGTKADIGKPESYYKELLKEKERFIQLQQAYIEELKKGRE